MGQIKTWLFLVSWASTIVFCTLFVLKMNCNVLVVHVYSIMSGAELRCWFWVCYQSIPWKCYLLSVCGEL